MITYLIFNREVWSRFSPAQQALIQSLGRDHVLSSYGENLRQQGPKLQQILAANTKDAIADNDLMLAQWPERDLALLREATLQFLTQRATDPKLGERDRRAYSRILESLRRYISSNQGYWQIRSIPEPLQLQDWPRPESPEGDPPTSSTGSPFADLA
jgi:hypothetical protein